MKLSKLKKLDGSIEKYAIPLLTIVSIFILVLIQLYVSADIDKKDKVDLIARKYILRMETVGYLTTTDNQKLVKELNDIGVTNINISGTTLSRVGYGEEVFLLLNCDLQISTVNITDKLTASKGEKTIPIKVTKSSTAKY